MEVFAVKMLVAFVVGLVAIWVFSLIVDRSDK
jgi:undecaprenyl pyrophosphate phosphatase UppP